MWRWMIPGPLVPRDRVVLLLFFLMVVEDCVGATAVQVVHGGWLDVADAPSGILRGFSWGDLIRHGNRYLAHIQKHLYMGKPCSAVSWVLKTLDGGPSSKPGLVRA